MDKTILTIIVVGYNRPHALESLFDSLKKLYVDPLIKIRLVISIDNGGTNEVNQLVHEFEWPFGSKEVIIHQEKKGLVKHFIWVGEQTKKYGHVLFLEDDLIVSPDMINFSLQAIDFYENDDRVAGISLYNTFYSLLGMRFYQIQDGFDNYFLQHPYWGNIWFKNKWSDFSEYLKTYQEKRDLLPIGVDTWNRSFKKIFIQYLIETKKTMVIPRISFVSNNGIAGLHNDSNYSMLQVPIMYRHQIQYRFSTFDQSMAKYDAYEEIYVDVLKRMNPLLNKFDFEIDTKCVKKIITKPFVLTSIPNVKNQLMTFSSEMKPLEYAAALGIPGNGLSLVENFNLSTTYGRLSKFKYDDLCKNSLCSKEIFAFTYFDLLKRAFLRKLKR
jgi:hypothetical protein